MRVSGMEIKTTNVWVLENIKPESLESRVA